MAKVGTRKIAKVKLARSLEPSQTNPMTIPISGGVNIFIPLTRVVAVMSLGFEQPVVGLPIMREGFVTGTGLLQSYPFTVKDSST